MVKFPLILLKFSDFCYAIDPLRGELNNFQLLGDAYEEKFF